ncbi:MAG: RIP metalloprotease RseP [Syntrophaceae bacterium]|nr:RIP metalloprotease RseP [Syntrophaceae bacterium]
MTGIITLIAFIVLLGLLIFAHELGHFLMAKRAGVGVLKFSLGFGPRLLGRKVGETEYLLSAIPLGGYVKLLGESSEESLSPEDRRRSFLQQPVFIRIAIVAAGPLFNILLAMLIFALVNMVGLPVLTAEIGSLHPDSAAAKAGLQSGDQVVAINGQPVGQWDRLSEIITASGGKTLRMTIQRGGASRDVMVTPTLIKTQTIFGEAVDAYKIGVSPAGRTVIERKNPLAAITAAGAQTWTFTKLTVLSIIKIFQGILSPKTLGGPILIAQIAGTQVREGIVPFFLFAAILSINLAVLNLLPIPVLDGGHIFFFLIELITGREVSVRWRERAQQVGFAMLMGLMLFVFMLDIERLNFHWFNDLFKFFTG